MPLAHTGTLAGTGAVLLSTTVESLSTNIIMQGQRFPLPSRIKVDQSSFCYGWNLSFHTFRPLRLRQRFLETR